MMNWGMDQAESNLRSGDVGVTEALATAAVGERGALAVEPLIAERRAAPMERVFSIDVFRGLTMLLMIFVNELDMADIKEVPWWMKHASFSTRTPDYMTFPDVIAPAFLFIVG